MLTYAEREIFSPEAIAIWVDTVKAVFKVSKDWGNELRCHEMSRAVYRVLHDISFQNLKRGMMTLHSQDGDLFTVQHSWLVLREIKPDNPVCSILDPYCPGRMPGVQLIHNHFAISRGYKEGDFRQDINWDIVDKITREMLR